MDLFPLVSAAIVTALLVGALVLGARSKRSALEILDWKPQEVEGDDVEQMLEAQNALRRRRGKPERTLSDVEAEWRES